MIPVIADFFHVSMDHLLGRDDAKEKARVNDYLAEFEQAISVGGIEECIRIARASVAEFPNNYALLNKLMYVLFGEITRRRSDFDTTNPVPCVRSCTTTGYMKRILHPIVTSWSLKRSWIW